ncbi:helix-turn-helix domain-containing protein [Pseudoxanthomonas sp. JBR18]|uniref:helix-turn-helix transcriptional regulator n=1 Tax=Pseudoxanthomonas sp. JBR18 TaxID=2969308 RepID=UPI00230529AD|nr:helix-turn-helix domain-containing protein [Pseudoxanthomonas sp. JBR18]WCE06107.1 helix-turn-helix domain-containing protein [Pseudoxanthomonas sp. JBR18]
MHVMADRIRQARRLRSLSQTQLAQTVGVQRSAVAQWERAGGTHPSVEHLAQIAVTTQVLFEWLATGRGQISAEASAPTEHSELLANMAENVARDEVESNVLQLMRKLSPRRRSAAYQLLRAMVG